MTTDDLILQWAKTQKQLADLKIKEAELRAKVIETCIPKNHKESGTETINLGKGWKLQAVFSQTAQPSKEEGAYENMKKALYELQDGEFIINELIKTTEEVSFSGYKKLTPSVKEIVNKGIVIKDGSPQLKLVPPKEEAK